MKIVINALQYKQNSSGIGVMIRDLFGLFTRITKQKCQVVLPYDGPDFIGGQDTEYVRIPWNYKQNLRRMFFQTFQMGISYCRDSILLTTDSKMPLILPKSCIVVPLITDLAVYRMQKAYQLSRVLWWRLQYWFVRRRANFFLAISEFTKEEMIDLWGLPPEKIHVIPCACSQNMRRITEHDKLEELRAKYNLPEHFLLFVGNFNPRKNLERLIHAYDQAKTSGTLKHQLVIAGEQGWKFNREAALEGIDNKKDIRFIGFVPDEDMPTLYSAADVFLFPTLYEGFGIPVIEAQSCGTPVLTSNTSSLPEVSGEAAIYVDPYSEQDISAGILKIANDPLLINELRQKGYENARRFSWDKSAEMLYHLIEKEEIQ